MTTRPKILNLLIAWRSWGTAPAVKERSGPPREACLGCLLALVFALQPTLLSAGQWDLAQLARMQNGEVVVETLQKDQPGGAARVSAMFYGKGDALWDVLGDCRYEMIYVQGLQECEVLQAGSSHMVIRHRVRNSWYTPTLDFSFTADRLAEDKGVANFLDGNLKVLQGSWEVTPIEGGDRSIITHEIRVQPKFLAPRWLIRRSLLRDLPDMLACVRGLANASGDQSAIAIDRKRCPGDVTALSK